MAGILFVCTANRIRSPMAEHLMKARLVQADGALPGDLRIESAGTWAGSGQSAMRQAQDAAAAHGLDLAAHCSRSIEAVDLEPFDLILTMEVGQRDALRSEFDAAAQRIFTLTEAVTGLAYDVDDPIGQADEAYRKTFEQLAHLIEQGGLRLAQIAIALSGQQMSKDG